MDVETAVIKLPHPLQQVLQRLSQIAPERQRQPDQDQERAEQRQPKKRRQKAVQRHPEIAVIIFHHPIGAAAQGQVAVKTNIFRRVRCVAFWKCVAPYARQSAQRAGGVPALVNIVL